MEGVDAVMDRWGGDHEVSILIAGGTGVGRCCQTAACLRALPVATLLANENSAGYTPNINGSFLPLPLATALATGQFHHVPVIQGTNHDRWRLFTA